MCESEVHKNWPRAHSDFMISSLYGPLSPVMAKAHSKGYNSVLWMVDDYIKELTYGNIFIHQKSRFGHDEIITPAADGTILNGVARQNVIENLKRDKNAPVLVERDMSIVELANSQLEERLYGVFSSSTEKGIQDISELWINDSKTIKFKDSRVAEQMRIDIKKELNSTNARMTQI